MRPNELPLKLRRIAEQLRQLPKYIPDNSHPRTEKALLMQADAAGRLLREAMDADAWAGREYVVETINKGFEQGYAGAWILFHQDVLPHLHPTSIQRGSSEAPGWAYTFVDDCRVTADLLDAQAAINGEAQGTDTTGHDRITQNKKTGRKRIDIGPEQIAAVADRVRAGKPGILAHDLYEEVAKRITDQGTTISARTVQDRLSLPNKTIEPTSIGEAIEGGLTPKRRRAAQK